MKGLKKSYLIAGALLLGVSLGGGYVFSDWWVGLPEGSAATYVGRDSCIRCHQAEADMFHGSHHDLAMDIANPDTVLANFDDQKVTHYGITSRLFRDGDRFMVNTEGEDGEMHDFEIKYVFGVEPLQQYMVEFDRDESMPENEVARIQVLRLSWNTEKEEWFYLSPPDVDEKLDPTDPLHWTGPTQCWNTTCADCHSTNLRKNFDEKTGIYHTTFSEIDVSCEACHGPGSLHVEMAEAKESMKTFFWDRKIGYGLAKLKTESNQNQIESCAPCHSRRRMLKEGYHAGDDFQDFFATELLGEQTYHADGQILDEVYVYGSFIQSKMYHENIKCTDCHDPHTAQLKFTGNLVCTSCHQHDAGKYDSPAHHQHQVGGQGALCVNCHMPESLYMDVDWRRDHSLRVPRPDLSVDFGTPNSCTGCHIEIEQLPEELHGEIHQYQDWLRLAREGNQVVTAELDRVDQQMAAAVEKWYGPTERPDSPAEALLAARSGDPDGAKKLAKWLADRKQPAMIRATAAMELARYDDRESYEAALDAIDEVDPMIVTAAMGRIETYLDRVAMQAAVLPDARQQIAVYKPVTEKLAPKLRDANRGVRIEATRILARIPLSLRRELFEREEREAFEKGLEEFETSLRISNDRALAYVAMGNVYEALSRYEDAEQAYRTGIFVEPFTSGPRSNLAALLEQQADGLIREAQRALQSNQREQYANLAATANLKAGEAAMLRGEELQLLIVDAERLPDAAPIQYRVGLALHLAGRVEEAQERLELAYELDPEESQFVLGLALLYERRGQWPKAIEMGERLVEMVPEDETYQALLKRIKDGQTAGRPLDQTPDQPPQF